MIHERKRLAEMNGFGFVSYCSCGIYTIQAPGVALQLSESGFRMFAEMVMEAMNVHAFEQAVAEKPHRVGLRVVH